MNMGFSGNNQGSKTDKCGSMKIFYLKKNCSSKDVSLKYWNSIYFKLNVWAFLHCPSHAPVST